MASAQILLSSSKQLELALRATLISWAGTPLCPVSLLLPFKDTTRPRKSHEKEGVEYHFVSKQAFEADLHHNRYVNMTAMCVCAFVHTSTQLPHCAPSGASTEAWDVEEQWGWESQAFQYHFHNLGTKRSP